MQTKMTLKGAMKILITGTWMVMVVSSLIFFIGLAPLLNVGYFIKTQNYHYSIMNLIMYSFYMRFLGRDLIEGIKGLFNMGEIECKQ